MMDLVVVGGGVGGLAAAYHARKRGQSVALLESADRLGGVVRTSVEDGFTLEHGPDSLVSIKPGGLELVRELGLDDRLVGVPEAARRSLIARRGRLVPVPDGLYLLAPGRIWPFVCSPLISWPGKLRMGLDLLMPRRRAGLPEESLAGFVRRRLGREALEAIAQPMVSGIYTADPEQLSLAATMPQFLELERVHGSLIRGMMARMKQQKAAAAKAASGPRYGLFLSLTGGLQTLVDALAARLDGAEVRTGCQVERVRRDGDAWLVEAAGASWRASRVVLAVPAHAAARMLEGELAAQLAAIPYAGVATVNLAFDGAFPLPQAAGFVIPAVERRGTIACTIAHAKYPGRAPAGTVLLRAFVGGALHESRLELSDEVLVRETLADLRVYLGALPEPRFTRVHRWPKAMAQYVIGHQARVARIRELTPAGLHLVGNGYDGVGIPDVVAQAAAVFGGQQPAAGGQRPAASA
jgi:oxygen-dependent protoporphyrinogen oxidase